MFYYLIKNGRISQREKDPDRLIRVGTENHYIVEHEKKVPDTFFYFKDINDFVDVLGFFEQLSDNEVIQLDKKGINSATLEGKFDKKTLDEFIDPSSGKIDRVKFLAKGLK